MSYEYAANETCLYRRRIQGTTDWHVVNVEEKHASLKDSYIITNETGRIDTVRGDDLRPISGNVLSLHEGQCRYMHVAGQGFTRLDCGDMDVYDTFNCSDNKLTDLDGCPKRANHVRCMGNPLRSLKGCPPSVEYLSTDVPASWQGCPEAKTMFVACDDANIAPLLIPLTQCDRVEVGVRGQRWEAFDVIYSPRQGVFRNKLSLILRGHRLYATI